MSKRRHDTEHQSAAQGGEKLRRLEKIESKLEALNRERETFIEESRARLARETRKFYNESRLADFEEISGFTQKQLTCSNCSRNMTSLIMAESHGKLDYVRQRVIYHCEACSEPFCFYCLLESLVKNPLCDDSIGFPCDQCNFFNCNLISVIEKKDLESYGYDSYPWPLGYSTVPVDRERGDKLPTSDGIVTNDLHCLASRKKKKSYFAGK